MADNIEKPLQLDQNVHRRVLGFLNAARRPEDLMAPPPNEVMLIDERIMDADEVLHHAEIRDSRGHPGPKRRPPPDKPLIERELAKRVLRARDDYSPVYGFRHISQLEKIPGFDRAILDHLIQIFSPRFRGKWEVLYADAD
jgi:hypothetical protein